MSEFFVKLDILKDGITDVKGTMEKIRMLKQEAVQATAPEQEKRENMLHQFLPGSFLSVEGAITRTIRH